MKLIFAFWLTLSGFNAVHSKAVSIASIPRIDIREEAKSEHFNANELEILNPIIDSWQARYDEILFIANEDQNTGTLEDDSNLKALLSEVFQHFPDEEAPFEYDTELPSVSDLSEFLLQEMPSAEAHDMISILQENINDASKTIHSIVAQSKDTEAMLISINKIKIVKFLYRVLGNIFELGRKGARAAYCSYSYLPQINSTLTEGRETIGSCYVYTRNAIQHLRSEVQSSINVIRGNVAELVAIYKKIANRESLLGKLFTLLLNVQKIIKDITETRETATNTISTLKNEVPVLAATVSDCATVSIPSFANELNETIHEITTCITFVDDSTFGPEPEPESSEEDSGETPIFAPQK